MCGLRRQIFSSQIVHYYVHLTYTIDFLDEVLEDKRGGEPIIHLDGLRGDVLEDHLHCSVVQLEALN